MPTHSSGETIRFLEKLTGGPLTFGKILKYTRQGEGQTRKQFARILGISRSFLIDLERGRKGPTVPQAVHFATTLGYPEHQYARFAILAQIKESGIDLEVEFPRKSLRSRRKK